MLETVQLEGSKQHLRKQFHKIAPDQCTTTRHIRRRISRYVLVDVTW